MSSPRTVLLTGIFLASLTLIPSLRADRKVVVTSTANKSYTERKFGDAKPRTESYVFMQGNYFEGLTPDRSIDNMPFRRIAEYLAPELGRQNFFPATEAKDADLLLVVHWGTTVRHISLQEMTAQTTSQSDTSGTAAGISREINEQNTLVTADGASSGMPTLSASDIYDSPGMGDDVTRQLEFDALVQGNDQIGSEMTRSSNVALLGYGRDLNRYQKQIWSGAEESTLRHDLASERYFIIVKAYDLKAEVEPGRNRRAVWTLHLNMSSPGNNFQTALASMSRIASNYAGRTTDSVKTVRPEIREGKVTIAPFVIIGEK